MQRIHLMPFGAQVQPEGVRFSVWAPAARTVSLCLEDAEPYRQLEMPRRPDGWYERHVTDATPNAHYRYLINVEIKVPDPASRFQPEDVHGPSQVIDPGSFDWTDTEWRGRPWEEVVLYELHVGTFTPKGTFTVVRERLDYLADLGVTAIELMPVADFPGHRNWGYDGVLPFAPDSCYGQPNDLKELVQAAHTRGLMVFLDVVYNHFGPEGNYLHTYAPQFFDDQHRTPWGAAINFGGAESRYVRDFVIHNALYWLEEYHIDGLRLDAVHAIFDESDPDILTELANTVARGPGRERYIHLILENDNNATRYLRRDTNGRPCRYTAQWDDDAHHALHVLVTDETSGYYQDYADNPTRHLGRCLTEGFAYQGQPSPYRNGSRRGEPTRGIPVSAFVTFLQNHDQIGNRAMGDRITALAPDAAVRAVTAVLLLAPLPPLLFMGQEWGTRQPFLFFCDFGPELARAVTEGRRREFARFPEFNEPSARERIPDPNDIATYRASSLDWSTIGTDVHRQWLSFHRDLLQLRRREIVPRLKDIGGNQAQYRLLGERSLEVQWRLGDGSRLTLLANLSVDPVTDVSTPPGYMLYPSNISLVPTLADGLLAPWCVTWFLDAGETAT